MSQALNTILIVGVLGAVAYFAWTQCWFNICNGQLDLSSEEFNQILPGLFTGGPKISQQDSQRVADSISKGTISDKDFNKLPTYAQNPSTSNYRSVRRSAPATAIKTPTYTTGSGTKLTGDALAKTHPWVKNANSSFAQAMYGRLSV